MDVVEHGKIKIEILGLVPLARRCLLGIGLVSGPDFDRGCFVDLAWIPKQKDVQCTRIDAFPTINLFGNPSTQM